MRFFPIEWSFLLPSVPWVAVTCHGGWTHFSGCRSGGGRASRSCRRAGKCSCDYVSSIRSYLLMLPSSNMAPATSLESDDFSEGRMLSCLGELEAFA